MKKEEKHPKTALLSPDIGCYFCVLALSQLLGWGLNTFKCTFQDLRPGAKNEMKYSWFFF